MKTLSEIAKEQGVKAPTLAYRLWEAGIEASVQKVVKGRVVGHYNKQREESILAHLKKKPIQASKGRPRKEVKA